MQEDAAERALRRMWVGLLLVLVVGVVGMTSSVMWVSVSVARCGAWVHFATFVERAWLARGCENGGASCEYWRGHCTVVSADAGH